MRLATGDLLKSLCMYPKISLKSDPQKWGLSGGPPQCQKWAQPRVGANPLQESLAPVVTVGEQFRGGGLHHNRNQCNAALHRFILLMLPLFNGNFGWSFHNFTNFKLQISPPFEIPIFPPAPLVNACAFFLHIDSPQMDPIGLG